MVESECEMKRFLCKDGENKKSKGDGIVNDGEVCAGETFKKKSKLIKWEIVVPSLEATALAPGRQQLDGPGCPAGSP